MTPGEPPGLSESSFALCFLLILLIPCASAGLALINAGLGRFRNAAHSMTSALCVIAVAAGVYFVVGAAWQGYTGQPAYALHAAGRDWNWIGAERFFLRGVESGGASSLAALFGLLGAGLAAIIPLGSGADRWRLGSACASTALLAAVTYPLFAHWAWGGGWLAQMGFVDSGGASAIQAVGGLTALSITWILGPRRGKFSAEGMPAAIPVTTPCWFCWAVFWRGWDGWGWTGAGAMLFTGVEAGRVVLVAVNTTLAAVRPRLAAAAITRARFGKTDASLCANGWVAGLVAVSAGCAVIRPAAAVIVGLVGGALVVYSVEWLELHFGWTIREAQSPCMRWRGLWGLIAVGPLAAFYRRVSGPVAGAAGRVSPRCSASCCR